MTFLRRSSLFVLVVSAALAAHPAAAQVDWDTSGNSLLNGTFNYREVTWLTDSQGSNTLNQAVTEDGTITFDGAGGYQIQATVWDSNSSSSSNFALSGTYRIAASGLGFLARDGQYGGNVYGGVSHDVFIGSSTESAVNNLFIAARAASPTTSSFNSTYAVAYVNFPNLNMDQARDALYRLTPDGNGGLASVNADGFIGGDYTPVNQVVNSATYSFSAGVGTLSFGGTPAAQTLLAGDQRLYVSPDGEFIFGGGTNAWDMFVGVRAASDVSPDALNGLFYSAGVDVNRQPAVPALDTYYGAFQAYGSTLGDSSHGNLVAHQRLLQAPDADAYDFTFSDYYALDSEGLHDDFLGESYVLGASHQFRVGVGLKDYLGISVGVAVTPAQGSGVFLSPTGVLNGASFVPFTAGLAPGTLVTMFGTGFADDGELFVDGTFPTTLGGLQVLINGELAPVYVVSPTQISVVMPYDVTGPVAEIHAVRDGTESNHVTVFVNNTSPGIFTVPTTGLGYAAALHPDYSLITPQNPALPGETVAVFLTGLGAVSPPVAAGTLGPVDPFSTTTEPISSDLDGSDASIVYSGLAPQLPGLYQLNIKVPADARAPFAYLEVAGPDALNSQVTIPVGGTAAASEAQGPAQAPRRFRKSGRRPAPPRGSRGGRR